MPPALDRLLASPSALRLLRSLVDAPELPPACIAALNCCNSKLTRRKYSNASRNPQQPKWARWHEKPTQKIQPPGNAPQLHDSGTPNSVIQYGSNVEEIIVGGKENNGDDAKSWAEELAQQDRLYGAMGIEAVWENRCQRGFKLPTDDTPDAAILWGTFLTHGKLVMPLIEHASALLKETGKIYPHLYELVIGYWLPRNTRMAMKYHHKLLVKLRLRKLPLRHLARLGASQFHSQAYDCFMQIYRISNERDLYDEIVPPLIRKGHIDMARHWHMLCFIRGDLPSKPVASHHVVQLFTAETSDKSQLKGHRFRGFGPSKESEHRSLKYNQELMRRLLGRDTAPVRFEDAFCARMFATKAFPPESIIKGLVLVGVNEIGPQALLTMASRVVPISELSNRFEDLRAAGISLQGCVFSLALEKFTMEKKWDLVRSIINTDQHPDVFDDAALQRKLLDYYLAQKDWMQVHRTLAILTLFHNDPSTASWNLLLQTHIRISGPQYVMQTLQDMKINGVMVSSESVASVCSILRSRQKGHKPGVSTRENFDDLRFVSRVFMTILETGIGKIPLHRWSEIIRRYGMLGRVRELRRLIIWLVCWYTPRGDAQVTSPPKPPFLDAATEKLRTAYPGPRGYFHFPAKIPQHISPGHPIRKLIPPSLQQGLIIWGFRAGILPNATLEQSMLSGPAAKKHFRHNLLRKQLIKRLDWTIGLKTLVELRDLGLNVHRHTIIKALQMQFINLFGRGRSRRKENRVMEQVNQRPYVHYVRQANKIWGEELFAEPERLGKSGLYSRMWHPRLIRRMHKRKYLSIHEILGPDWQKRNRIEGIVSDNGSGTGAIAITSESQQVPVAQDKAKDVESESLDTIGIDDGSETARTQESENTHSGRHG